MHKVSIYTPEVVQEILVFYGPLLELSKFEGEISQHLNQLSERLYEGIQQGHHGALTEVNNYHPECLGIPIESLKKKDLTLETAQQTIASEYGFKDMRSVIEQGGNYKPLFEEAVFLLLQGDLPALRKRITAHPELLTARSHYGHGATLLHYTANNGIEIWRQVVPENLPEIAKWLINQRADKNATMSVYGGHHAPYFLATSSAHPYDAGIAAELLAVLE